MSLFSNVITTDKIVIKPDQYVSKDINQLILKKLKQKVEGICTYHGYIKPGSCSIVSKSEGKILDMTFNGNINYNVVFKAQLCNPDIDSVIKCKVVNTNNFGILAISYVEIDSVEIPIIEAIVVKKENDKVVNIGDTIAVKIRGKKFDLHDKKITVHGVIVDQNDIMVNNKDDVLRNGGANEDLDDDEYYDGDDGDGDNEDDEDDDCDDDDDGSDQDGGGEDDVDVVDGGDVDIEDDLDDGLDDEENCEGEDCGDSDGDDD